MRSKKKNQWRLAQWLEIRWWKRYLSNKEVAPYLKDKRAYWLKLCEVLEVEFEAKASILDAGCGPAGLFLILEEQNVVAIDPLLDQYQNLSHFEAKNHPNILFQNTSIEDFTSNTSFDWVCCLNAINHVEDWGKGMDILSQAVNKNGQLLLGIDVHNHSWLKWIFRLFPADALHPHQHDRQDYRKALHDRGWTIKNEYTWKKGFIFDYWLVVCNQ